MSRGNDRGPATKLFISIFSRPAIALALTGLLAGGVAQAQVKVIKSKQTATPAATGPVTTTPVATTPVATTPSGTLEQRCRAGDSFACESHAWEIGNAGSWLLAAHYAKKGCDLGRATACTAERMYRANYSNHGDKSDAGAQAWRAGIVEDARKSGNYTNAIRLQLRNERDLETVAALISWGGQAALRNLSFDEMADLAGQNWQPNYSRSGGYVQSEWQRRGGARQQADAARPRAQQSEFQGVGENENGTASCSVNGRPGTRYQYSGPDGRMVYGPCTAR